MPQKPSLTSLVGGLKWSTILNSVLAAKIWRRQSVVQASACVCVCSFVYILKDE